MATANQDKLYDFDVLKPAEGTFAALNPLTGVVSQREGAGFACMTTFRYLSGVVGGWVGVSDPVADYLSLVSQKRATKKPVNGVFYPSATAATLANITPAVGVGGLAHEVGHFLCDLGGYDLAPDSELSRLFEPTLRKLAAVAASEGHTQVNLTGWHRWTNILADCRLERLMSRRWPTFEHRFRQVADWIYGLEAPARQKNETSLLGAVVRDFGKGWLSDEKIASSYSEELFDLAAKSKHIWGRIWEADDLAWEDSAYLPPLLALQMMLWLRENGAPPEPPKPSKGNKGDGKGKGKGGEGKCEGEGDEGEGEGDEGEGDEGEGDEKGQGEGGDGDGDEKGEGSEKRGAGKTPSTHNRDFREVEPEALDPSSAFEEALKEGARKRRLEGEHMAALPPHPARVISHKEMKAKFR